MKKRILPLLLVAALLIGLLAACAPAETDPTETSAPATEPSETTPTETEGLEDGYIPAPYTVSSEDELTAQFLEPVYYENENGPTIGVTLLGVVVKDGLYFRDLDNDQELDDFEDWRLDADTRSKAMAAAMSDWQLTQEVLNLMAYSPSGRTVEDVVDENGNPVWSKVFPAKGGFGGGGEEGETNIAYLNETGLRTFVLRSNPATEVAVWFNNGLEQYSEYDAITRGEAAVPFMMFTNPISHGLPGTEGVTAAALGAGNADIVLQDAQLDRQIMWAKGVDGLYGPQIDLVTDPRWSRNTGTYGEREDMASEIARNLVIGYQNGDQGMVSGSVLVTVKHFPGDGAAYNGFESHGQTGRYRVYTTENSLADYQLKPFIAAFEAGAAGVMPGYSQPIIDERIAPQSITYNGQTYDIRLEGPGNAFNSDVLLYLLREVLGFDGLINSDSISSSNAHGVSDLPFYDQVVMYIKAGCDCGVLSGGQMGGMELDTTTVAEALANGDLTREDLERAAANRLKPHMQSGNLENPYRDMDESVATVDAATTEIEALAEQIHLDSIVLMKNTNNALPLSDNSVKVYVHGFNQKDDADVSGLVAALEAKGYTIVEDYNEADVAYLRVTPTLVGQGSSELAILDLAEDVETPIYDENAKRTEDTALVTTVASIDDLKTIADAVHANGGKVVGQIEASNAWILTNMEPYCDALIGTFSNTDEAIVEVVSGAHAPTGKLPITMVADASVIALVETTMEDGEVWDICVSPNDVPGYVKDQYMDADVLAASPSGSYAYKDTEGNLYVSGFGLTY